MLMTVVYKWKSTVLQNYLGASLSHLTMSLYIPVVKQVGVVSLPDSLGLYRTWLVATSSFGCMGDMSETHISGTPVKIFWITVLGDGAQRNLSPSVLLSSLSLPTSIYHLFMYLCIFSHSFLSICLSFVYPSNCHLSIFISFLCCCCSVAVHLEWLCTA